MLNAFEQHLKQCEANDRDRFHREFRSRMGKRATDINEQHVINFIMTIPKYTSLLYKKTSQYKGHSRAKYLGGFALSYLYNPKDFLPEDTLGLFGYLDDAYLVARSYQLMLYELSAEGISLSVTEETFLQEFEPVRKILQQLIPVEKAQIEKMIDEILENKEETYSLAFAQ